MKENSKSTNILITSASGKIPLIKAAIDAAFRIDKSIKIIAGDRSKNALSQFAAHDFWIMPQTIDDEIDSIIKGCKERGITCLLPTRDGELLFWAKNKDRFLDQGISIIISSQKSIETCLDKLQFANFGSENNLQFIPASKNIEDVSSSAYVVKERFGAGSKTIGINLSKSQALLHASKLQEPLFQPYISGKEISIDGWIDSKAQLKGIVLRTRDIVDCGESKVTTTFRDPAIEKQVVEVLEKLRVSGPLVLQAMIDEQNNVYVIECNSRFGGASTASIKAGLDILYWSFLEGLGRDVSENPFQRIDGEVRQIRMPVDSYDCNI